MSVPNLDSLRRQTKPRAESSGDWKKTKKHCANSLNKSKANSTIAIAQCTSTIVLSKAFLLLTNGFRFRTTQTKTWGFRFRSTKTKFWGFRFRTTKTQAWGFHFRTTKTKTWGFRFRSTKTKAWGFRFRSTKVFVFVVWKRRPCVSKNDCFPSNENFPAEAYRLLESILDTKYSKHKLFIDRT